MADWISERGGRVVACVAMTGMRCQGTRSPFVPTSSASRSHTAAFALSSPANRVHSAAEISPRARRSSITTKHAWISVRASSRVTTTAATPQHQSTPPAPSPHARQKLRRQMQTDYMEHCRGRASTHNALHYGRRQLTVPCKWEHPQLCSGSFVATR